MAETTVLPPDPGRHRPCGTCSRCRTGQPSAEPDDCWDAYLRRVTASMGITEPEAVR